MCVWTRIEICRRPRSLWATSIVADEVNLKIPPQASHQWRLLWHYKYVCNTAGIMKDCQWLRSMESHPHEPACCGARNANSPTPRWQPEELRVANSRTP